MHVRAISRRQAAALLSVVVLLGLLLGAAPAGAQEDNGGAVVDGTPVAEDTYPYVGAITVPLAHVADPWAAQFCAGVLIAPRVVATTAYCTTLGSGRPLPVSYGAQVVFDQVTLGTPITGSVHTINGVSRHPRYLADGELNDLSLLRLSTSVPSDRATPVPFASGDEVDEYPAGEVATIAGWGSTAVEPPFTFPATMQSAETPIRLDGECDEAWSGPELDDDTTQCAGVGGGTGICDLDEGGPLLVEDTEGDDLLVGLAAFGPEVCGAELPDVFTELAGYEDFIAAHISDTTTATFSDVRFGHPFLTEIWAMKQAEVLGGFSDGSYRPGTAVSRQAMSAFLFRLAGEPAGPFDDPGFTDVGPTNPFLEEISWMASEGITTGDGGLFRPSAPVSRAAMAAFMFRFLDEPDGPFPNPGFPDVTVAHPFFEEISWMADTGITTGFADGTFRPAAPVTRQSMAAFLYRLRALLP
jgi:secreted trypsin-like serine protease